MRRLTWFLLGLLLAVGATSAFAQGVGEVTYVFGQVDLTRAQRVRPVTLREGLVFQDQVNTRPLALAKLLFQNKATVTVRELSRLTVGDRIDLRTGMIRVVVDRAKMRPGELVEIRTPNAVAGVRGSDGVVEVAQRVRLRGRTEDLVCQEWTRVTVVQDEWAVNAFRAQPFDRVTLCDDKMTVARVSVFGLNTLLGSFGDLYQPRPGRQTAAWTYRDVPVEGPRGFVNPEFVSSPIHAIQGQAAVSAPPPSPPPPKNGNGENGSSD